MSEQWRNGNDKERSSGCPPWETLVDLTYDELEPVRANEVRAHIEVCEACTNTFKELLAFLKVADGLPGGPVSPSPVVEQRLKEQVSMRRSLARRWLEACRRAATTPMPVYQALLLGAALALLLQLLAPETPRHLMEVAQHAVSQPCDTAPVATHHAGVMSVSVASGPPAASIRKIEPTGTPTPPVHPRSALRFSSATASHAAIAEVF